jgi:hypothetical protein
MCFVGATGVSTGNAAIHLFSKIVPYHLTGDLIERFCIVFCILFVVRLTTAAFVSAYVHAGGPETTPLDDSSAQDAMIDLLFPAQGVEGVDGKDETTQPEAKASDDLAFPAFT